MPIYEYECQKCGEKFEDYVSPGAEDNIMKCPKCGGDQVKRATLSKDNEEIDIYYRPRYGG